MIPDTSKLGSGSTHTGKGKGRTATSSVTPGSAGIGFALVILYYLVEYLRPHEYLPVLKLLRPGLLASGLVFLAWLSRGDKSILREPIVKLYIGFLFLMALGVLYGANRYWPYVHATDLLIMLVAGLLPTVAFLDSERRLMTFFQFWLLFHVAAAAHGLVRNGYGPGSFLGDANDLALALNIAIPYAYFLSQSASFGKSKRFLLFASAGFLAVAVASTLSRGGFLGLMSVVFAILWLSNRRNRDFIIVALLGFVLVLAAPPEFVGEVESIQDANDETRNERLYSWRRGFEMFLDNPVLGVGAGNYPWRVMEYELQSSEYDPNRMRLHGGRASHSLYFTLIPELGLVGIALYIAMLAIAWRKLRSIVGTVRKGKTDPREDSDVVLLAKATLAAFIGFLTTGAFISVLYYPHFWYLLGFSLALYRVVHPPTHYGVRPAVLPGLRNTKPTGPVRSE